MKKLLFGIALAAYASANGQALSENFDALSVGDYMGVVSPDWTTWSGATGGAEDVQVVDDEAASGSNSIYFSSTSPAGGPQDVLLPFGGVYTTGTFTFESKFYIEADKGAYFNFQGTEVVGGLYTLNCQMIDDGRLLLDAGAAPLIETTFTADTWFTLTISVNLNTNDWELLIDGVSQGSFANPNNQCASADLYPVNSAAGGNNIAGYYMDDVSYNHGAYTLPAVNGAVTQITNTTGLVTTNIKPTVEVRNLGTDVITSFDLAVTYNGETINETVTGVSIASLATYEVEFDESVELIAGENDIVATISNVNGAGADDDGADDVKTVALSPIAPAAGKIVVAEEGTGTWCGWCPRGAVFLDRMEENYPEHFIGIAVHNGDPMVFEPYDTGIGALISGYPSLLVDRGADIDPSAVEGDFLDRVVIAPKAVLKIGSDYVDGATTMNVSVTSTFNEPITGDYRVALVLIEDGVTGTTGDYAQANYYAGGGSGVMGGYELLSDPVPAADMVYDHVARLIAPSFAGIPGVFPASVEAGDAYTVTFEVAIDPSWDLSEVHLVGMLIAPGTEGIDNAGEATIDKAVENGYVVGVDELTVPSSLNVYPNPTVDFSNIDLGNVQNENVIIQVFDMNGKLVSERNYGVLNGAYIIPVNAENFEKGIYNVRVTKGNTTEVVKLIVE